MRADLSRYRSLLHPLLERAERRPDWPALVVLGDSDAGELLSAGRFVEEILAQADALSVHGIGVGDIVVLALDHSPRLVSIFFAAIAAGAVPTILPAYVRGEDGLEAQKDRIAALVQAAEARAVVVETRPQGWDIGAPLLATSELEGQAGDGIRRRALSLEPEATAYVQYTSGSAGRPKGIAHTHDTVLRYLEARRVALPVEDTDVFVSWLPLYHDFGLLSGVLVPQIWGARSVLLSPHLWVRDPAMLIEAIARYRGTVCYMPNFALNHMARAVAESRVAGLDVSCWRELAIGAEPVRSESIAMFLRRFERLGLRPQSIRAGYGMAEVVEGATCTPRGRPPRVDRIDHDQMARGVAVPASATDPLATEVVSVGVPFPRVELRVVAESGEVLPERRLGEIEICGPFVMRGYHRDPQRTAEILHDGWLATGDLGYLSEGELFITGRKKDLVIVGGRNIHPEDVEQIADRVVGLHPGRSVAFGMPDERLGSEKVVMVCEPSGPLDPAARERVERELRGQVARELGIVLAEVHFAARGWVVKTTSGKTARPLNREKYLRERAGTGDSA